MEKYWVASMEEFEFGAEVLTQPVLKRLRDIANECRGDILKMTTIANSGHPGGSMSSIDIYTIVYSLTDLDKNKVVVSHGHTSPGVYSILGRLGIIDREELLSFFRYAGGPYEGHVESHLPHIVWSTGNLGQGLSAGCGFAIASKLKKENSHTFVLMSDAEQTKGQVAEARRFASKFSLNNLTVVIDYNHRQISGKIEDIMPVNIKENYIADGWRVLEVDGHNFESLYEALHTARNDKSYHYAILSETVMGKGVSFMEGNVAYHGSALSGEELERALNELGIENDIDRFIKIRKEKEPQHFIKSPVHELLPEIKVGTPREYKVGEKLGNRNAFGNALAELGRLNEPGTIVALDCDLAGSVGLKGFGEVYPEFLIETGVSEHNTATVAGVLSTQGIHTFLADFGVFGIDEMYNQQRLNAINGTKVRLILTHCGINVGEDGKTHHCIDYLGMVRNLPGFAVIIPADINQTDRIIRYLPKMDRNVMVVMGRAKEGVISDLDGKPIFGGDYEFEYGKIDVIRDGNDGVILSYGYALRLAIEAQEILAGFGISLRVLNVSSPLEIGAEDVKKIVEYRNIFTYEDHLVGSGLGSIIGNLIALNGISMNFQSFGITDFAPSGNAKDLFKKIGLDPETVANRIKEKI